MVVLLWVPHQCLLRRWLVQLLDLVQALALVLHLGLEDLDQHLRRLGDLMAEDLREALTDAS